ncbi:NIPSNAP family protein [Allostreptomyces psammosilenae]|uniref:Quinol monooxygenase YgiN n=1 Tax=Allostreptomyces psammosilenae TaxID=1892865 RepID=A0A852ZWN7_9ACTN|nr:NIPSNAP family protein [Allostreptomyces psammosilenae]NYI06786.1 quinol monooxygenase YgiN [Allostreptomyces psammosilenae]
MSPSPAPVPTGPASCGVVELRQYTLLPGRRAELVDLFDRHFVESQEEVGMRVVGQFLDLGSPDRFVWLRAFPDMAARAESLAAFYLRHPAWREHGAAANATMVDSDDVLLLRPATDPATDVFPRPAAARPPLDAAGAPPSSLVTAAVHHLAGPAELAEFVEFFHTRVRPALTAAGAPPVAVLRTEPAENTFPRLPVRTGEHVLVSITAFRDAGHHRDHLDRLAALPGWREEVVPEITRRLARRGQLLRLAPTPRSLLR